MHGATLPVFFSITSAHAQKHVQSCDLIDSGVASQQRGVFEHCQPLTPPARDAVRCEVDVDDSGCDGVDEGDVDQIHAKHDGAVCLGD